MNSEEVRQLFAEAKSIFVIKVEKEEVLCYNKPERRWSYEEGLR